MVKRRTVDLLPEIFRTETNQQFLSATLDQLTQEPSLIRTQGYVGRRVGPGVNPADNYVIEPTEDRTDYQLEPGVVFYKPNTSTIEDAITYPGIIDALALQGANTQRQDRLFQSEFYSWDPFCDLDKFVNYSQYYWLPAGPDSVDVGSTEIPLSDDWTVSRTDEGYAFSDVAGVDPILTLVRGGSYEFTVNQPGINFWIQAFPGANGRIPSTPNISSRDVLGVVNNGEDQGTITFNVPQKNAQDFFYTLNDIGNVDLLTSTLKFNEINNVYVNTFLSNYPTGIDGITNLDSRTIIFTNTIEDAQDGGWQVTSQFDPLVRLPANNGQIGSYDSIPFDQTTDIDLSSQRYSIWQIQYIPDADGQFFMRLSSIAEIPNLSKFRIRFGDQWANTQWYKNASSEFEQIPLLTAVLDDLWYQDSVDPDFFGRIRLVDLSQSNPLDVNEIIGAQTYTSPNGIVFTNGLKVQFRGPTNPPEYQDLEFYVEGVGTGPGINSRVGFIDGEAYFGPWHRYQNQKLTGSFHRTDVFQQIIYDSVEQSLANIGSGLPVGAPISDQPYPLILASNGIKLLPVRDFVTPETYTKSSTIPYDSTSYDSTPYDAGLNAPEVPDYITINRASVDRNAWSRSNRWFHEQVIRYTAEINNQVAVLDNRARGKRPIIEFRANLELYNFGTQSKAPVNIIDFSSTDAFSNINGQLGYGVDGYEFLNGTRVIFAADRDLQVRNRIYRVEFIDPDGNPNSPLIINLVPTEDSVVLPEQTVVSLSGNTQQGVSFWFDGITWQRAQQKTGVNQAPLFNVRNANGHALGDLAVYPSSTFAGSRLFGYAEGGTQITDEVLGLSLKYLNIRNVGDIVFENYFYNDTFLYVRNSVSQIENISLGFVRQYLDRISFSDLLGWQQAAAENRSRQVFKFVYDGSPLILDVPVDQSSVFAPLQIFQGVNFVDPVDYTYSVNSDGGTTIILLDAPENGTIIEVQVISDTASQVAYYQVPSNLENNTFNGNSSNFTLGTIRTHYQSIGQNLKQIRGPINGANNTRDLGDILRFGTTIIQNSSPLALSGVFLRRPQFEVISAIEFNSREYEKYKALLLDLSARGDFVNLTPTQILDDVISEISLGRNQMSPFYWTDMIPAGENYRETVYVYTPISTEVFDTFQTYDFQSSNFQALSVYLNGRLLTRGHDYVVSEDAPIFTVITPLVVGDQIVVREYTTTYGNYVPNTPTKMGMYPAFQPKIYLDTNYLDPTMVIRGHDGSITVAFGDARDQILLEFETRIFNNLKIVSEIPLTAEDVIPGQFRTTDYSLTEINEILGTDFLAWVGWNKLDYAEQNYIVGDAFTYNYSQAENKLNQQPLLGAWRGIYQYLYDTTAPNTRPWEMLGFSQEPLWWQQQYGPAPYTSGNLVLWEDLELGVVRDPMGEYVLPQYQRPGLLQIIPCDCEGELLPPLDVVVGNFNNSSFRRSWTVGDVGPVEYTWKSSSAWPFAVMRLLALTKPAKFFSLFADRDRYVFDATLEQFLWEERYRLDAKALAPLYGNGVSRASYIDWIIDYNRQLGINSTTTLEDSLNNIGVQLCWRMAGYSDKKYLKVFTERSTPNGLNTGLLLPDESYRLLLYKNQPFEQVTYSSVIVQKVSTGWQVLGYSTTKPYFEIVASRSNGATKIFQAGGASARVSIEHTDRVTQVPYGYVFKNVTAVCDFIYSYGILLGRQGFVFDTQENGYIMDWSQMVDEFLYWSNQGWSDNSMINLNPAANRITVTRPGAIADDLTVPRPENLILNQNRQAIPSRNLVIERLENTIRVTSQTADTINYFNVKFTAYEHMMVLDNLSIFADLIFQPITGARQSRVRVAGTISGEWNGTLNAPGFILNQDNIQEWRTNQQYSKGEIVLFKDEYWASSSIIQPSQEFDYTLWIRSDYDQIQKGLLPNAANSSDQLAQAYSVYNVNLEQEVNLFSYGLIGFRPREYMQALNLDDTSQVGLYQQFLGTKGTVRSTELFTLADIGKEKGRYEIYEYWALLRDTYGATANRNYIEILLDESKLTSDPALVQVVETQQVSQADQTVQLQQLWKTSQPLSTTNIFPSRFVPVADAVLPSAGYVNINDVDLTLFDLSLLTAQDVANLGIGSTLWVAKSNQHDWEVYRVRSGVGDVIEVADNLDGRSVVTFDRQHGLKANDWLIIKFFNTNIDGAYRVVSVPSITTVLIDLQFAGDQTVVTGQGVGFTLESARVEQPADIASLSYAKELTPGARVWIDNDGQDRWAVVEKVNPFVSSSDLVSRNLAVNSGFGTSISQGLRNLAAMVGAPTQGPTGTVHTFVKDFQNRYIPNLELTLDGVTGAAGFGNAMDSGDQTWAVVGASQSLNSQGYAVVVYNPPTSNAFVQWQLLLDNSGDSTVGDGDEFGYSVTVSQDERWIYVGAPGANRVYAYGRVDAQDQTVRYTADGATTNFLYSDDIVVNDSTQLIVVVNNITLILNTEYVVSGGNIVLNSAPDAGSTVVIARRAAKTLSADGISSTIDLSDIYTAETIESFSVYVDTVLLRPVLDYTYNSISRVVTFETGAVPPANSTVEVRAGTHYRLVEIINAATDVPGGIDADARFGHSVTTTTDGRTLLVGAPGQTVTIGGTTYSNAGKTFAFDRSAQRFQVSAVDSSEFTTFTTQRSLAIPGSPITVTINGQFLVNDQGNINGEYQVSLPNTVNIDSAALAVGDIVEIETNQFSFVQAINDITPFEASQYGYSVDQCVNDCSLYIGAPYYGAVLPEAGHVHYLQNQSRVYGSSIAAVVNPVLTPTHTLRVNDYFITVPTPAPWIEAAAWVRDSVVVVGSTLYQALIAVPANTPITDTLRWKPIAWAEFMSQAINSSNAGIGIPNAQASATADLLLEGNGVTREFVVGPMYQRTGTMVFVDNILKTIVTDYTFNTVTGTVNFVTAPPSMSVIRLISAQLTVSVVNLASSIPLSRLWVSPGTGTVFQDLGFETYVHTQTIDSPRPEAFSRFGQSMFISDSTVDLMVGAPNGTAAEPTVFDRGTTIFDANSQQFFDVVSQSGVVYSYDFLPAADASVANPGQFVFGQQIYDDSINGSDQFGLAIDYTTGVLLIGAPGEDLDGEFTNYGRVAEFNNPNQVSAWSVIRQQTPVVDSALLNTVFMYDRVAGAAKQYFDYIDPLQGRILGAARQNIDYIGGIDPAAYNVGNLNNYGDQWTQGRVGEIWWDTTNVRFIDPNQDDIVYASRRWSQVFPGSTVDVYQWIASEVPPAQYSGPGVPRDVESYSITSDINEQGFFGTTYFFWVSGLRTVNRTAGKTLSTDTIERYIENPRSSGIAYIAAINSSTIAIYNGLPYVSALDTIIHVEYDQTINQDAVHAEYQLIPENRADGFLDARLYRKMLDSFCGVDTVGNLVPDINLPPSEKYGIESRPRQSMFVNRFLALQNYLSTANDVMAQFPLAETRTFPLLRSQDPEPTASSDTWDMRVADLAELSYQNINIVPIGYRYLVAVDSNNDGRWTIYEVITGGLLGARELRLTRVQNYNTNLYWNFRNWYRAGYNPLTRITAEVPTFSALESITVPEGSSVKVTSNFQGRFEIYQLELGQWQRVALENGTIEISSQIWDYSEGRYGFDIEVFDSQYFDQEPVVETRRILQSLNQEIFIDDLAIERNRLLILMFNYILTEQIAPLWLTKTSLIDVDHVIRNLEPFQIYRQDNQDFVLDYIQEVKPYHTQIKSFNLIYQGNDVYDGDVTDFDVPAYWDTEQNKFISPILSDVVPPINPCGGTGSSVVPSTDPIWQELPWSQWYQNYLLEIQSVRIADGGSGYTIPPVVIVVGECERPAQMVASINGAGQVSAISVIDPGLGYSTTALLVLEGGNGTGARAVAVMGNSKVRSIKTVIKYDRCEYASDILPWQSDTTYQTNDRVRYNNQVWQATEENTDTEFDFSSWEIVPAGDLSGVDRTMGYYTPTVNQPGLDLALLITGVDYPGVQVTGPGFDQNSGFDVGNYDINPFDNISFGPEGYPTYDPAILDAIYESEFDDPYLGTLPAPAYNGAPTDTRVGAIEVNGGAFVDTYSSHAPEELVPGAIFDTLDLRVFTTPGSDWIGDGHGFDIKSRNFVYQIGESFGFGELVDYVRTIRVYNKTDERLLDPALDYNIDWQDLSIAMNPATTAGSVISVTAYGVGGGNQIYRNSYNGADVGNRVIIPVTYALIDNIKVFVNGELITDFTSRADATGISEIDFDTTWTINDYILVVVFGTSTENYSWSSPVTEYIVADGVNYAWPLTNSLQGTNTPNIIVDRNGFRARPAEGARYVGNGTEDTYALPDRGGYSQALVSNTDVDVYVDGRALILGIEFSVNPFDSPNTRTVSLVTPPALGSQVLVSVDTGADYYFSGTTVIWKPTSGNRPIAGDILAFTTWNDTAQQDILTQVFVGPTSQGIQIREPYDSTDYDEGNVVNEPGSYDFAIGASTQVNRFDLGRLVNASRLIVTINGRYQFPGSDFQITDAEFLVQGTELVILGPVIGTNSVVSVTSLTDSTIPGEIAFRIFQDMRGNQYTYRITADSTTQLLQSLSATDSEIHVKDASRLAQPDLERGLFGVITINGERITYRTRNTVDNVLGGLRRGTAGTGAATHSQDSPVYSMGIGQLLPVEYQDRTVSSDILADGSTTEFTAEDIALSGFTVEQAQDVVEVYVGGILQTNGYTINSVGPVVIEFDQAPASGYQVSIQVRQGLSWYTPGVVTASDGRPLQETNTQAARFIRGE